MSIDVTNETHSPEITHWHGLTTDPWNDGASEEGSPMIAPGETQRYYLRPNPSGTRWYHTHVMAGDDLSRGTYSGQFGFLLVEPDTVPAPWDLEVNLAIHHWQPSFVPMVETLRTHSSNAPQVPGSDVGYKYATINGHMLGAGEPIRVKAKQRVLMRLLNASATENVVIALPGHCFEVLTLDGNPVPRPQKVEVLALAVAERADVLVEMNRPGVWILGSVLQAERTMGLGIVIEYAGQHTEPRWTDPPRVPWDYTIFGDERNTPEPDEIIPLTFRDVGHNANSKFDTWTINGASWPAIKPLEVQKGKRYRLLFRNGSGDQHPMHLHRHSFELTKIGSKPTSGLMKDVVNVMPLQSVAVDFVADNPGDTLMHCHQQLHMDYGFMQLLKYTG